MCAALALLSTACTATPYAAIINGKVIPQSELMSELNYYKSVPTSSAAGSSSANVNGQGYSTFNMGSAEGALTGEIEAVLVKQLMVKYHAVTTPFEEQLGEALFNQSQTNSQAYMAFPAPYRKILAGRVANQFALQSAYTGVDLTPSGVQSYYDSHTKEFASICLQAISFDSQQDAQAALDQVNSGKLSFDKLYQDENQALAALQSGGSTSPTAVDGLSGIQQATQAGCAYYSQVASQLAPFFTTIAKGEVSNKVVGSQQGPLILQISADSPSPASSVLGLIVQSIISPTLQKVDSLIALSARRANAFVNPRDGSYKAAAVAQLAATPIGFTVVPPASPSVKFLPPSVTLVNPSTLNPTGVKGLTGSPGTTGSAGSPGNSSSSAG